MVSHGYCKTRVSARARPVLRCAKKGNSWKGEGNFRTVPLVRNAEMICTEPCLASTSSSVRVSPCLSRASSARVDAKVQEALKLRSFTDHSFLDTCPPRQRTVGRVTPLAVPWWLLTAQHARHAIVSALHNPNRSKWTRWKRASRTSCVFSKAAGGDDPPRV